MTTKQDIRNIQCQQVNAIENKLRYIAENVEEIIIDQSVVKNNNEPLIIHSKNKKTSAA